MISYFQIFRKFYDTSKEFIDSLSKCVQVNFHLFAVWNLGWRRTGIIKHVQSRCQVATLDIQIYIKKLNYKKIAIHMKCINII